MAFFDDAGRRGVAPYRDVDCQGTPVFLPRTQASGVPVSLIARPRNCAKRGRGRCRYGTLAVRAGGSGSLSRRRRRCGAAITATSPTPTAISGGMAHNPRSFPPLAGRNTCFVPRLGDSSSRRTRSASRHESKNSTIRLLLKDEILAPEFRRERSAFKRGIWPVAGCDEPGAARSAGPVVAAAVVLDPDRIPRGLNDSEADARTNARSYTAPSARPPKSASRSDRPPRIDRDNILRASLWALAQAVAALPCKPKPVYVEGRDKIAVPCDCEAVISRRRARACRSPPPLIVAKVDARPADEADRRRASRLRLRTPYGVFGAGARRGAEAALAPPIHHRRSFSPRRRWPKTQFGDHDAR